MTRGKVGDIRTGHLLGQTRDMVATFTEQYNKLLTAEVEFHVLHGVCRHHEVRVMLDLFRAMNEDVPIVCDRYFPPDTVWLVEGKPEDAS